LLDERSVQGRPTNSRAARQIRGECGNVATLVLLNKTVQHGEMFR